MPDQRSMIDPELVNSMADMKKTENTLAARVGRLEDGLRKIMASQAVNEVARQMARDALRDPQAPPEGNTGRRRVAE